MNVNKTFQAYKTCDRSIYAIWHDTHSSQLVYSESQDNGSTWEEQIIITSFEESGEVYLDIDEFKNVYILFYGYENLHLAVKKRYCTHFDLREVPGVSSVAKDAALQQDEI